jgi:hypothetical protein
LRKAADKIRETTVCFRLDENLEDFHRIVAKAYSGLDDYLYTYLVIRKQRVCQLCHKRR